MTGRDGRAGIRELTPDEICAVAGSSVRFRGPPIPIYPPALQRILAFVASLATAESRSVG